VDRLTRHELKHDEFRDGVERAEQFLKERASEILTVGLLVIAVAGLALGLKLYVDRQEAGANEQLSEALRTFRAYVGAPTPGTLGADAPSFPTAEAKYKKAQEQFSAIVQKFHYPPRPKAVSIAQYHQGLCQSFLGNHAGAIETLREASRASDPNLASLAGFALAGELSLTGKTAEAANLYQHLADHPTLAVPAATALIALADTYRASQPARARQIYQRVSKEFGADASVAAELKQQIDSLPK